MFSTRYQQELQFLRGLGKEFAALHPAAAGLLAERGGDPDVERLLEGFAFLAARIRERLDAAAPELIQDLAEILVPHVLRPVPAATVIEFQPTPGALRSRVRVPAGAELGSVPVEGVSCRFRTTTDVDLLPVTVVDAALDQAIGATPVLRLSLQVPQPALASVFDEGGIRFFLQGELPFTTMLLLWLGRHLKGVQVKGLGAGARPVQLPASAVRLPAFGPDFPLLPWPALAPAGYRTLLEYFTLPQKFLFFEVRGLNEALGAAQERFELALQFDRPPDLPARPSKDHFRPNCAPAVNLFAASGEPIRLEALGEEHLVRAADLDPHSVEVFQVESVAGLPDARGRRRAYPAFAGFDRSYGTDVRYHRLRRRHSPLDGGMDVFLSVLTPRGSEPGPAEEILSLELTCTNRSLPGQLRLGDVSVMTPTSPTMARFRNIVPVTKPVRPPLDGELQWRLVSHLAAGRSTLCTAEALRSLLSAYDFPSFVDQQAGRANQLRIEGLRSVEASEARRLLGGAVVRGTRLRALLDEAHFASPGDAFLFGSVLDELLASQVPVNAFVELAIRLDPSHREYAWTPRNGTIPLL
jgi:type VI secretion system protein ImpG